VGVVLTVVLFLVSLAVMIFIYVRLSMDIQARPQEDVGRVRREVTSLTAEFNRTCEENISILEEKISELNSIAEYADRKIYELQILQDRDAQQGPSTRVRPVGGLSLSKSEKDMTLPRESSMREAAPVLETTPPDNEKPVAQKKTGVAKRRKTQKKTVTSGADVLAKEVQDQVSIGLPKNFASMTAVEKAKTLINAGHSEASVLSLSGVSRSQYRIVKNIKENDNTQ
jgi:hypothetical protein